MRFQRKYSIVPSNSSYSKSGRRGYNRWYVIKSAVQLNQRLLSRTDNKIGLANEQINPKTNNFFKLAVKVSVVLWQHCWQIFTFEFNTYWKIVHPTDKNHCYQYSKTQSATTLQRKKFILCPFRSEKFAKYQFLIQKFMKN